MKTNKEGFIRFVPMLLIAVALMGLVGYVSVTRLKEKGVFEKVVLGDTSDVNENDLKNEENSLNNVEELSLDELEDRGLAKESPATELVKASPSIAPLYKAGSQEARKTGFSFLDFFDSLLKGLEGAIQGFK